MPEANYRDYGYSDAAQTWSHAYLWDVVSMVLPPPARCPLGVIDLGCGNGAIALRLFGLGYKACGIDASASGIAIANQQRPGHFHVVDFSLGQLPAALAGRQFDVVLSTEVIEHLYDPRALIKMARSVLVPGGTLIITTPYHGYLKNLALAAAGKLDGHFTVLWDGGHIKVLFARHAQRTAGTRRLRGNGFPRCGALAVSVEEHGTGSSAEASCARLTGPASRLDARGLGTA